MICRHTLELKIAKLLECADMWAIKCAALLGHLGKMKAALSVG